MSQPPQPVNYQMPPRPQPLNAMALISLILGIISCLLFCFWFVAAPCAVIAIVLAAISMGQIKKTGGSGRGMAITGLILGIVGLLIGIVMGIVAVMFRAGATRIQQKLNEIQQEQQKAIERQKELNDKANQATQPSSAAPEHLEWRLASGQTVYLVMPQS